MSENISTPDTLPFLPDSAECLIKQNLEGKTFFVFLLKENVYYQ